MSGEQLPFQAATLLNRRFFRAYWYPTLLSFLAGLFFYSWLNDWKPLNQYLLSSQDGVSYTQLEFIFATLIITLALAHLLEAFSNPFIQFWEGYWPEPLWEWYKKKSGIEKRWKQLKKDRVNAAIADNKKLHASLHEKLFSGYPSQESRLLPTQLGNALRASEDYAKDKYGMDVVFWWPRLWLILPGTVQEQIDDSQTSMLALLNFTTLIGMISIIGSFYLYFHYAGSWVLWALIAAFISLILGLSLTTLAYRGAVSHAKVFGLLIRSTVDTYRFDLLKALHQPMPSNLSEEKKIWDNMLNWIYLNEQEKIPSYVHPQSKT